MAVQPNMSKPGLPTQRQSAVNPVLAAHLARQSTPLWIPLMMIVVTALSVAAIALTLLKPAPETVTAAPLTTATGVEVVSPETVEDGKLMLVKVADLERNLNQAKMEIQRLNEELLNVRSSVEGLNANVSLVQAQSSRTQIPVNIQPPQPEGK